MNLVKTQKSLWGLLLLILAGLGWILLLPMRNHGKSQGDEVILWLAPPTSVVSWQRFVQAMNDEARFVFGKEVDLDLSQVAPVDSGLIPEVVLRNGGRVIRWRWAMQNVPLKDLLEREIKPSGNVIGVIGGSTTESALQLARALEIRGRELSDREKPILVFHTATADHIHLRPSHGALDDSSQDNVPSRQKLVDIYAGRTFRFGFDNSRMADLVTKYVLDLYQPSKPRQPFMVEWEDDPYGLDVLEAFHAAFQRQVNPGANLNPVRIRSGVAALELPNRHEIKASQEMAKELEESGKLGRPWIVLGGQSDPCRRFLAGLSRNLPTKKHKELPLIALGDTLGFNRVFLDQRHLWPADDLPFELVFFCHQDPASVFDGFQPNPPPDQKWLANSTDDLLLWRNIAGGLIVAWNQGGGSLGDAGQFRENLSRLTVKDLKVPNERINGAGITFAVNGEGGRRFFDDAGNRRPGTGEHLVHLEPIRNGVNLRVVEVGQGDTFSKRQRTFRPTEVAP